jgi:serine/threonine-protein kinase
MPTAATLSPGLVLDQKYRVLRHIADGGMGAIYEAEHLTVGRRVAVKVLHAEFARNAEIIARFQQEARAAGAIGHQHIVDVLDMGRFSDGQYFLVMELLEGKNLAERLTELGGRMPVDRAAHIMRQVLNALAATHQRGIVHRDLKPENIFLIARAGDPDFVKVLDFGISKVLTDDLPKMSTTGQVLGTPYFMSPEQTRGAATDHRVDIYACGAILYQLVTGRLPFLAPNFNALMFEIAGGRYFPPRSLVPEIPAEVEQVIQYAMALEPQFRYQTADHMALAVAPFARAQRGVDVGAGGSALPAGDDRGTPSALRALAHPGPPGLAPVVPVVTAPVVVPRGRALPITIGAGVAVGVFVGLLVIRHMDRPRSSQAGAPGESASLPVAPEAAMGPITVPAASPAASAPTPAAPAPANPGTTAPAAPAKASLEPGAPAGAPRPAPAPALEVPAATNPGLPPAGVPAVAPLSGSTAPSAPTIEIMGGPGPALEAGPPKGTGSAPAPAKGPSSRPSTPDGDAGKTSPKPAAPGPPHPAPQTPPSPPLKTAPPPPAQARITVVVVPADAPGLEVTVDGQATTGSVSVPVDKRVKITVKAKGYQSASKSITVKGDQTVEVKLSRKPVGSGPGGALGL